MLTTTALVAATIAVDRTRNRAVVTSRVWVVLGCVCRTPYCRWT